MSNKKIVRSDIADYLLIKATGKFAFMGTGFNTLNEDVGAQIESKTYICDTSESSTVKGYKTKFAYDLDVMYNDADDEEAAEIATVEELYFIGRDHAVGTDAEREYVRTEFFLPATPGSTRYFKARKFKVAVEVTNSQGAGGDTMTGAGNLNCVGNPKFGYFDIQEKVFTEGDYTETLGTLAVTSAEGSTSGATKITVSPVLDAGHVYMYKTASTITAPALNDDCTGYSVWNGSADISAITGNKICIVEVDSSYKAKKVGIATVVAKVATLGSLTISSVAGSLTGNTKITVTESLTAGNSYVYKTAAVTTLPNYEDVLTTGYSTWDGVADLTATTGNEIMVVEVDSSNKAKKVGKTTVTSK